MAIPQQLQKAKNALSILQWGLRMSKRKFLLVCKCRISSRGNWYARRWKFWSKSIHQVVPSDILTELNAGIWLVKRRPHLDFRWSPALRRFEAQRLVLWTWSGFPCQLDWSQMYLSRSCRIQWRRDCLTLQVRPKRQFSEMPHVLQHNRVGRREHSR